MNEDTIKQLDEKTISRHQDYMFLLGRLQDHLTKDQWQCMGRAAAVPESTLNNMKTVKELFLWLNGYKRSNEANGKTWIQSNDLSGLSLLLHHAVARPDPAFAWVAAYERKHNLSSQRSFLLHRRLWKRHPKHFHLRWLPIHWMPSMSD